MRKTGAAILIGALLVLTSIPSGAAPLPSRPGSPEVQSDHDLAALEAVLEMRVVRDTLAQLGLTPDEVKDRLARLSPAERHQLAAQAERVVAGGQDRVTLLIVLILLIILIAILI